MTMNKRMKIYYIRATKEQHKDTLYTISNEEIKETQNDERQNSELYLCGKKKNWVFKEDMKIVSFKLSSTEVQILLLSHSF